MSKSGKIRAAKMENSPRLASVHGLLQDGRWHGTREIVRSCDVCAVNTIIAELRDNGIHIETRCVGQGRYEYRMSRPAGLAGPTSQTSETSQTGGNKI